MFTVPLKQGFDGRNFVITLKRCRQKIGGRDCSARTEFYLRRLCLMINTSFFPLCRSLTCTRKMQIVWLLFIVSVYVGLLIKLTDGQPLEKNVTNQKFLDRKIDTNIFLAFVFKSNIFSKSLTATWRLSIFFLRYTHV